MNVPLWGWLVTVGVISAVLLVDLVFTVRRPHTPSLREAAWWSTFYVLLAFAFGTGVWFLVDPVYGAEFFAGYVTEKSLSVDNLFVFMLIMTAFRVPAIQRHTVLLVGVALALLLRGIFIAIGAALIAQFSWIFFVFGAILVWTAISMVRGDGHDEYHENWVVRRARKIFPVTEDYVGGKVLVKRAGKRLITPMFIVIIAVGTADVLFAVDSIPAIFGITQEAFLVFTANAFALMGLRQLYFLIGGLVERLTYLTYGLAIILIFIGAKLFLHAFHEYEMVPAWMDINTWVSLGVIVLILVVTTMASIIRTRRVDGRRVESGSHGQ
ncbi:TerC family protein [Haloechinothrix sp. YIM 98757]|uniref:TerC family protein n=1 Tax=Haloechinothrix aidingensis TaxID=2752311 RepID=A0A838AFN0_9PSEU|nr:TerC family protein [Haloechinothrix aidingensis]MBA0128174.1 TerC family protein [Haloechinothrix aidingensis]